MLRKVKDDPRGRPDCCIMACKAWPGSLLRPELEAKLLQPKRKMAPLPSCSFLSSQYITHLAKQEHAADESG